MAPARDPCAALATGSWPPANPPSNPDSRSSRMHGPGSALVGAAWITAASSFHRACRVRGPIDCRRSAGRDSRDQLAQPSRPARAGGQRGLRRASHTPRARAISAQIAEDVAQAQDANPHRETTRASTRKTCSSARRLRPRSPVRAACPRRDRRLGPDNHKPSPATYHRQSTTGHPRSTSTLHQPPTNQSRSNNTVWQRPDGNPGLGIHHAQPAPLRQRRAARRRQQPIRLESPTSTRPDMKHQGGES